MALLLRSDNANAPNPLADHSVLFFVYFIYAASPISFFVPIISERSVKYSSECFLVFFGLVTTVDRTNLLLLGYL